MKKRLNLFLFFLMFAGLVQAQNRPIVLEAEKALLGSDFEVLEEDAVQFVRPNTDLKDGNFPGDSSKVITFSVRFPKVGYYQLYAKIRVGSSNYSDDSFFLGRNFGMLSDTTATDWHIVNGLAPVGHNLDTEVVTGAGNVGEMAWKWVNISQFLNAENPVIYSVDSATDTLTFSIGAREDGLEIDKIAFGVSHLNFTVQNLELVQNGTEAAPSNNSTTIPEEAFQQVRTFVNPIMPGDHPDMTLFKDGDNFYACGSNFHFVPYLPILHSTDLVHWREICRVIPSTWSGIVSDAPQGGTWAGVITYFYDSYWIYFSNTAGGGQYFCKANSPAGPWSTPVKVKTTSTTGHIGYDNSVFVDDDGKPYMLIKPGQVTNRIQEIGRDGHLVGQALNLDWINADKKYSWAEGPVMCKRNGWYYYIMAGHVYGGQYVLRSKTLTADPESWEAMGNFFENSTDPNVTFQSPNHISQPFELADGTWWTISHSYEKLGSNDWNGQGRQGMLHQVIWNINGKPTGKMPKTTPQVMPNLPKSGIPWKTPRSDYFENDSIELSWHFMNRSSASKYSLKTKPGWLTLNPGTGKTHILHKESRHHYALVTKVDFDATAAGHEAGLYLTNGNQSITVELYSGYNNGKKIGFRMGTSLAEVENPFGNELWLKIERVDHQLKGFFSLNGITWTQVGGAINSTNIDKAQENYNWWVGTSNGLYAQKKQAHFDMYAFKDGFSVLPTVGFNNYFGLTAKGSGVNRGYANSSDKGGWLMLGGVDMGQGDRVPATVQVEAASSKGGKLELWIDDLEGAGTQIATIDIPSTGSESTWKKFQAEVANLSGQHDLYFRWDGPASAFVVKNIQFRPADSYFVSAKDLETNSKMKVYPNPFENSVFIEGAEINSTYQIFTLDGRVAESGLLTQGQQRIGQNLKPGFYVLKAQNEVIKLNKSK